jgi:Icc-related predicted phosphoesterase
MKFDLLSDIHLGINPSNFEIEPKSDILVMAGDVIEAKYFLPSPTGYINASTKTLQKICSKYKQVLWVLGNHEHYGSSINQTVNILRTALIGYRMDNVSVLDNESTVIDGVTFFGATFWTDINRGNPIDMLAANNGMNDYKMIFKPFGDTYTFLTPEDTIAEHQKSVAKFKAMTCDPYDPLVLIMHHAPHFKSIPKKYQDHQLSHCYYSDLSDLLLDHNVSVACHGHVHTPCQYMIGDTLVVANPRGYNGFEDVSNWEILSVEIK